MEIVKAEKLEKTYQDNGVPVNALKGIDLKVNMLLLQVLQVQGKQRY